MSEMQFACLSLTVMSTIANHLAVTCVEGWSGYYFGVARAATLTSYMLQILVEIIRLVQSRHPCYPQADARRAHELGIEVE